MRFLPAGIKAFSAIILVSLIASCDKDLNVHPVSKDNLAGHVQKGPFINGTSLTISELNSDLAQTGKNFTTQIYNNQGSFEIGGIELSSQFVELSADGFYYNEISDEFSPARLVLNALSDISEKNTLNVNLMSHLEKERVRYLISDGMSFEKAKSKAQGEILDIFSIEKADLAESELLDISGSKEDDAVLLAVSVIMQGYRSVAELSLLLADISADLKEDGKLDDQETGSALINHAVLLDLPAIRENLENIYIEAGLETELAGFEKYVNMFIENTDFETTNSIEYPEYSIYGENILYGDKADFIINIGYSLAANLPVGTNLTIRLSGGLWYYQTLPNGPVNWSVSEYDHEARSQQFTSKQPGEPCDLIIEFGFTGDSLNSGTGILVEYFENLSDKPTRTKKLTVHSAE